VLLCVAHECEVNGAILLDIGDLSL
jgi:hypothetical protein